MTESSSSNELTVEAIRDLRANPTAHPVHAESYLSTLSEPEWTELRAAATRTGKTENPALCCGDCGKPVYARESWKGRRHCYHFAGDHSDCRWSGAVAQHLNSIDAIKFHGQQEGEQHKTLSQLVAEVLALDPRTREAGISFRRYTKLEDGQYTYPDVYTDAWQGAPAAFEIQLSTTQLPTIIRREDFYRRAAIRLAWIVGYHDNSLDRRAFMDIHLRNDGQILGMDGEVAAIARKAGEPQFRLYRLLPGTAQKGFAPLWRNKIVTPSQINWGAPGDRPRSAERSYDSYLDAMIQKDQTLSPLRRGFYDALSDADGTRAGTTWDAVAKIVGGRCWGELPPSYDSVRALGVLATLRTGKLYVPSKIPLTNLPHLVNSMLLEPSERRCWTHAFELLSRSKGLQDLLTKQSVREKCERNRADILPEMPTDRAAGPVFNVFFPEGAFYRISLDE